MPVQFLLLSFDFILAFYILPKSLHKLDVQNLVG